MKIAFVDHSYHKQTKSTNFLIDILKRNKHEVEHIWDYAWCGGKAVLFDDIAGKYDAYVFLQVIPDSSIPFYKTGANITFIPMLDGFGSEYSLHYHLSYWRMFLGCKVLCFSKSLASVYLSNGTAAKYYQYFPNPDEYSTNFNNKDMNGFFWSRCPDQINWRMVRQIVEKININSMHLHLKADPEKEKDYIPPDDMIKFNMTTSDWFEDKNEYIKRINNSHLYFAPRVSEGIGMSFLEAMAMGKCVIAPNVGTMNEYISSGMNGVLYDIYNNKNELFTSESIRLDDHDALYGADPNKKFKLIPESISLDYNSILKMCKNARKSVELGYQHWVSKEKEIVKFLIEDSAVVYNTYFRIPIETPALPIEMPPLTIDTSPPPISPIFFTTVKPDFDENAVAGRVSKASREGLLAEGGLRMQGIYRASSDDMPLVSIITVVYNGVAKLERAMQSVFNQSYPNIEYIIIDGGSTDKTVSIIEKYADRIDYYISQKDSGIYYAMNKGVALSSGKFIGVVNSDDIIFEDGVYDAVKQLLAHNADFVAAQDDCFDTDGKYVFSYPPRYIDEGCLLGKPPASHGATIIGKKAYDRVGYYDTKYRVAADFKVLASICLDKELVKCRLFKSIHYFELGGASNTQQELSIQNMSDIVTEFVPNINQEHLCSLMSLMWKREWNERICKDLEELLNSDFYNDLQKSYLLNEMRLFGYAK